MIFSISSYASGSRERPDVETIDNGVFVLEVINHPERSSHR